MRVNFCKVAFVELTSAAGGKGLESLDIFRCRAF